MSGSSNWREICIDCINEAKQAKDKVYHLEQAKEIVLHRDTALLPEFFSSIMDFMVERTSTLRRFLIKFAGEAWVVDSSVLASVLSLFNYLMTDTNENIGRGSHLSSQRFMIKS